MNPTAGHPKVLLSGATGYVGGRLLRELQSRGIPVRCLARRTGNLRGRLSDRDEAVSGDVLKLRTLRSAMQGVETAYYLIHSMGSDAGFEDDDRLGAKNFAAAAEEAGVRKIIYLGGLGRDDEDLSDHLRSRHEVGQILRSSKVPTIEFRAAIIIGSGSLSFDLVRSLVRKLPIMICPRWVNTPTQPIGIRDVLSYLLGALERELQASDVFEIGGPESVTYCDVMREYANQRGLKRLWLPVPLLSPWLSSLWLNFVTPVHASVGRKLVEGLVNPTVVTNDHAETIFNVRPAGIREAIRRAIVKEDDELVETRWHDALSSAGPIQRWGGVRFGNRVLDSRTIRVEHSPQVAFEPIQRIGGDTGWYYADWLWKVRGWIDRMIGGVGLRRGRRHSLDLRVGDAVDFWRVENFEPNQRLRLYAEMKLPGRGWLEYEVCPEGENTCVIRQTAEFDPIGLIGLVYWYSIWPLHQLIFANMLKRIAEAAEERSAATQ
ncbi:MAG: SDR family oxidoreductase [Planctomycetota bacterium]